MGKPFSQELKKLQITYDWAMKVQIPDIEIVKSKLSGKPLFVVGSGGSLSACALFSLLHQFNGNISNFLTPLDLQYSKNAISRNTNVVFVSASGKNTDILFAFNTILEKEPENIFSICLKKGSALSKKSSKYSITKIIELDNPAGKDGFLATNSLIAYFTIISRFYSNNNNRIKTLIPSMDYLKNLEVFVKRLHQDFTLKVIYAGWGKPVALDIESKFSEAGLGNVLLADYRNFGHGRHNWFDKKPKQSAIIALITPEEEDLANKTLALLPKSIPVLKISTKYLESTASIDLLVKTFYLANEIGKLRRIDPGRPGVPSYGSKLYNLRYSNLYVNKSTVSDRAALAITRKIGSVTENDSQQKLLLLWNAAYEAFMKKLRSTTFKGIILDYDGTICSSEDRFEGPTQKTQNQLNAFLKEGILIGVVTGRGKSVRIDLQKFIPKKYWPQVMIGYYNGSQMGTLNDDGLPLTENKKVASNVLPEIEKAILSEPAIKTFIKDPILRPEQLTLEVEDKSVSDKVKSIIIDSLKTKYPFTIQVLESSHSVDIIPTSVSKISIIQACRNLLNDSGKKYNFLCIGDRGKWPGNDYQLLGSEFSLSVDKVSADLHTCWNLTSVGNNCVEATTEYFDAIKPEKSFFKIKL